MHLTRMPIALKNCLDALDLKKVYELRLRRNKPVVVCYGGKNMLLRKNGLSGEEVLATKDMIDYIVKSATENSIYAYNYQLKQGFITAKGGIRLGIAGESVVSDAFAIKTIKDINSVNIRVPHEILGCSALAFKFVYMNENLKNTLIISPPGAGKTTFLRDIARQISLVKDRIFNTLIVDERFEIASVVHGEPMLDIGIFADIVSGASKEFSFTNGIRALRPDVIVTDELINEDDALAVDRAISSGVKVIASVHASSLAEVREKEFLKGALSKRCFERFIVLSGKNGPGTYEGIFDENYNCIYF